MYQYLNHPLFVSTSTQAIAQYTQKLTHRQFCLVTVSVKKEENSTISNLRIWKRAAAPMTHRLTSFGSDSSPGNRANWILMIATCSMWPSSKYSNSHIGSASINTAKSSKVPAVTIVPWYTIAHLGVRSFATERGVLRDREWGCINSWCPAKTPVNEVKSDQMGLNQTKSCRIPSN